MSHSYRVFGVLALVVASLLVTAPPAAAASATGKNFTLPAVTKTTYSISGTVRANATSAAVADVEVYAWCTTCTSLDFTKPSTYTNASGAYTISHLPPGSYTLRFDPPRATNLQHGYRNATAPTYFSVSTPVAVTIVNMSLTGKNIRLPAGYKISGKVTRSNGTTPIHDVLVSANLVYTSQVVTVDETMTDAAGNYTLMGLSPGSYEVGFEHGLEVDDYQSGCWYTTPASKFSASCASSTAVVITTANVTGISPKIPNALKITGYVKTRASTPVPIVGAWVHAQGPKSGSAYTDATGKYTITGLNPGSYKIEVEGSYGSRVPNGYYYATGPNYWAMMNANASSVVISAWTTTLPIIKPPTGYYIKGQITNTSGTPIAAALVEAVGGAGTAAENPIMKTDSSGNYSIGPVPFGLKYKISADTWPNSDPSLQKGWYLNSPPNNFTSAASSALAILVNADKTGINMRLPVGASISGIVTITGGTACSSCSVFAFDLTGMWVKSTSTSLTGAYTLQGLSTGSYYVEAGTGSDTVIDATHVRLITPGYYKSGSAPNFSPTLAGATAIAVSP